ncbi:MAG: site-specific DNA-methyltransferase [Sulfurovum sp.]|nr:site-specific DNA-methyltransferase [Sulfurovum sp.]
MSLAKKIEAYIEEGKEFTLKELYAEFGESYKKHSIRARVYESNKVIRTGRGSYILAGIDIEAIIEEVDTKEHIYKLVEAKLKYDMIFLDIPYSLNGQKGGNRVLVDYNTISEEEFKSIIIEVEKLLKNDDSQVYFMIAGGKTSLTGAKRYINMFNYTGLKLVNQGSYTKLTKNGKVCNMGKYDMPGELILSYSKSGQERFKEMEVMNYRYQRPPLPKVGGYRTEKPFMLLKKLIERATLMGERVLDLFAGSGVTLEAGLSLGRRVHGLEISTNAIENFIMPRIKRFTQKEYKPTTIGIQTALF